MIGDAHFRTARRVAGTAAAAVAALADTEGGYFWRSTEHRNRVQKDGGSKGKPYPTVSLASAHALLRLERDRPNWLTDEVRAALREMRGIPQRLTPADLGHSTLTEDPTTPAAFTVAQHVQALSFVAAGGGGRDILQDRVRDYLQHRDAPLTPKEAGPDAHPFSLYHLLRAVSDARPFVGDLANDLDELAKEILERLKRDASRLLAEDQMGTITPGETVALIFCGAGLAIDASGSNDLRAMCSLEAGARRQEASGCWPLGRLVSENKDVDEHGERIEISTYEIAWAIADGLLLLQRRWPAGEDPVGNEIIKRLIAAAEFADRSTVVLAEATAPPRQGWCSDYPYYRPMIESWTSATTLRSVLSLDEVLREWRSRETLAKFPVSRPSDDRWPSWLRWPAFLSEGETDNEARVLAYIDRSIVKAINESPRRLPDAGKSTVSAVLFGPPGTAKTTVAKGVADGLGWPVVQLNPGVFIERGLELIEAASRAVFDDLLTVQRAVVLFDECDELFRERAPSDTSEQMRSITAFVTASMLPKLQQLHDEGSVVFFLCTNNFEHLDAAVKRRGRIDHIIAVGPPDETARERILRRELSPWFGDDSNTLTRLTVGTERFTRSELVYLAHEFKTMTERYPDIDRGVLATRVVEAMEPSLNITTDVFNKFKSERDASSHPHILLRQESI